MAKHADHYRFREELVDRLRRDLLGPSGSEDEIIDDAPVTAYAAGILFPRRRDADSVVLDKAEKDHDPASARLGVEEMPDTGVALANVQSPSSMGLTFAVDPDVSPVVTAVVTTAVYEPIDRAGNVVRAQRAERRTTDENALQWRRRPLKVGPITIGVTEPGTSGHEVLSGLEIRLRVRRPDPDGAVAVTLTLVNVREIDRYDLQDAACFFQPELRVTGPDGLAALVERPVPVGADEREVKLNRLLHRHAPTFATGHGCAADWVWEPPTARGAVTEKASRSAVSEIWTAFAPSHEVLLADSNPDIDTESLGMLHLAESSDAEIFGALAELVDGYRSWISDRSHEAHALRDTEYGRTAREQIEQCAGIADRMADGISVLRRDPRALDAFRMANRAMAEQRGRTSWIKRGRADDLRLDGRWRPFQIAFLLLCLRGVTDREHADREIADVLWFPTGGGKTEAYLGLIAYTVFLRRLRAPDGGGGVTALMRYTLRLLTLQQFERAASLICAMEMRRRRTPSELGAEEISIGMWVGGAATPNRMQVAAGNLRRLRKGEPLQEENPVQLRTCPWCGGTLDADDYVVSDDETAMTIRCPNAKCDFRDGLPVHVVDDEIYRVRPTLVIATVDKFAQIAWRADVAALFNRDRPGTPPPELIVQDELHLISGPLGTLTGLYETAIDLAADRPKVIASTATIRRAAEQGRALFDRDVRQFPPAGLDARDSWFSVETSREAKASRLYVGLMTPSTSQATLLIRAYAALLHHAARVDGEDAVRDAYWTLIGYFNSLRLLAAAELQVHADVQERLERLAERAKAKPRDADRYAELTSRVKSSDIPTRLKELELTYGNGAFDTVLATNMISVGVDVDRLGLMVVAGQPQTTAEYIQSTSRVGRQHPGLVVTLFNAARSRDRSHYENFASYHSALYRRVESTSVTPFSPRARDRGLHAVLVGLTRLLVEDARENAAAQNIAHFLDRVEEVRDAILDRVLRVAEDELDGTRDDLDYIIDRWQKLAGNRNTDMGEALLVYEAPYLFKRSERRDPDAALLCSYSDEDLHEAFQTLWSLRDVDVESDLYLER